MKKDTKSQQKNGKFGLWLTTIMRKRNITIATLSASFGIHTAAIQKAMLLDKAPELFKKRIKIKWHLDVPSYLTEEDENTDDKEDGISQDGRSPPAQKMLWMFNEFLFLYDDVVSDIIRPGKIIQQRDSKWGKELRRRRSRTINSTIFYLPTIKALYLINVKEVQKNFPRQTLKNLIDGIPMSDQVYRKFCKIVHVNVEDILHPALKPLVKKTKQLMEE